MELENIVANTVYLKAREGKWIIYNVYIKLFDNDLPVYSL